MEKIKNLPVMRFAAFAVALALILGICSVFLRVTASADTVTNGNALDLSTHQIGALGKYPVIGLPSSELLADYIATSDPKSTNNIVDYFVPFTVYNGVVYYSDFLASISYRRSYFDNLPNCFINLGGQIVLSTIYDSIKAGSDTPTKSTDYRYLEISAVRNVVTARYTTYPSDFYKCTYAFKSSKGDILSDTNVSSIMYARVLTSPYNATVDTKSSSYIKDTDFFHETVCGGSENGRFICFGNYKDYSYDEHLVDISNGCIHQLKDYDNKVKSYYTSFMFDSDDVAYSWVNKRSDENKIKTYKSKAIAFRFYNPDDSISSVRLRISRTMIMPTTRESNNPFDVLAFVTFHPANKHYSRYVVLSEGSLSSVPAKSTITARVDLQAYCDLYGNSSYLLELVNGKSNEVVSSVLMSYTGKDYDRFDSLGVNDANAGYIDVKYQFDKGNTVNNDVLIPDSDGVLPSLPNGVDDDTFKPSGNYDLSKVDITDIFATLNQSTASVGAFFQACFNILPATLVALILGSLALLIVLRVLGR